MDVFNGLLIGLILAIVGQGALLWKGLGGVQAGLKQVREEQANVAETLKETNKKSCPFPGCPLFGRATKEASQDRDIREI